MPPTPPTISRTPENVNSIIELEEVDEAPTSPFPGQSREAEYNGMTSSQALNLYTTHFLSTWNVRTYEFAAVSRIM
jgi:hypothetical protein